MTQASDIAQKLISLPSYVGDGCDERQVGEYVYTWLSTNARLNVVKQPIGKGRFNCIASGQGQTKILIVGHMDTVEPRSGWNTDPFEPVVKNGRLYGLGATDMKGSLAAGLSALTSKDTDSSGVMFLAYCDEEYDFAGMRKFVQEYREKISPALIISLDGSFTSVGNGCRGLIEVSFRLRGRTGHAGRPEAGINAITSGANCLAKLKRRLATEYGSSALGPSTLNVAYCQGGLDMGDGIYGRQGNNIADIAEFVLDIRPARAELTADKVRVLLDTYARSAKLRIENWEVRHNLGSWMTPESELIASGFTGPFRPSLGYIDVQMLWDAFGRVPCCTVGAGNLEMAHTPNEYVGLTELEIVQNLLIEKMKG